MACPTLGDWTAALRDGKWRRGVARPRMKMEASGPGGGQEGRAEEGPAMMRGWWLAFWRMNCRSFRAGEGEAEAGPLGATCFTQTGQVGRQVSSHRSTQLWWKRCWQPGRVFTTSSRTRSSWQMQHTESFGTLAISVICQPGMASTSSFVNTSSFAFASGAADGWRRRCGVRPDPVRGVDGVRGSRLESTRGVRA